MDTAVDAVESALYQKAVAFETVPMIFYLEAHRPIRGFRLSSKVDIAIRYAKLVSTS